MKIRTGVAAVVALLLTAGTAPAFAQPSPEPPHRVTTPADLDALPFGAVGAETSTPPAGSTAQRMRVRAADRSCTSPAANPVRDNEPIRVDLAPGPIVTIGAIPASAWTNPPHTDPSWRLGFYSFRWIAPLVRRAVEDGQQQATATLLAQVHAFYTDHPDPGRAVAGWDEGASLRRLETLNCLYRLTGDRSIADRMSTEANVLFGPRYYGPPRYSVHNHGLMANLRLVEAGRLTDRPAWVERARVRMRQESGLAFTRLGTSYEQSATYQSVNRDLWAAAADTLAALDPADPTVRTIRAAVARATNVTRWLTEPDGGFVQIGDSSLAGGERAPVGTASGILRDDQAGLLVGRSGWNAGATMYTLRYGPPRKAHGHLDKSTVTWTVRGIRVLVGPGYHGYDPTSPYTAFQRNPASKNAALLAGRAYSPAATGRLASARLSGATRVYTLTDNAHRVTHTRTAAVHVSGRTLAVTDAFAAKGTAEQVWHLAPEWRLVSGRVGSQTMTFAHPGGNTLQIRTNGRLGSAFRGSMRPVAGWTFPTTSTATPNWELHIRWTGGTARTTFQVR